MRIAAFLFLTISSFSLFAQSGVQFTTPIPVANGTTYGYTRPKITLDANNQPIILWGKSSTHQIFVSTYNGSSFNTPVQINPTGTHPYISSWYNADIKSTGDTIIAVFPTDMPANRVFLVKSIDGGNTWGDTVRVDHIPAGGIAYFPSCDINEWGEIAVTYMRHEVGWQNPRYVATTSSDGGNSFPPDTSVSGFTGNDVCDCCPAHMLYENDRQIVLFRNNDINTREFYAGVSIDNGTSFNGYNIDNQAWMLAICPSVAPSAFLNSDELTTVFMSGASGSNRIYVSSSDVMSATTTNVQMIDNTVPAGTLQNHPKIAGDDTIMAVVWYNTMPGEADIYFRYSNTGASGLIGDGINISNPTTGTQSNPDIAYANGVFHIVYQNSATQELYYLRAIMDEYIGIEETSAFKYALTIANENLHIQFIDQDFENKKIEVMDTRGGILFTEKLSNASSFQMSLSSFAHGIYFVRVEGVGQPIKFFW